MESSGEAVVELARGGVLVETLGRHFGGACLQLVRSVLLPYCRWPVNARRHIGDDYGDFSIVHERELADHWRLYGCGAATQNQPQWLRTLRSKVECLA